MFERQKQPKNTLNVTYRPTPSLFFKESAKVIIPIPKRNKLTCTTVEQVYDLGLYTKCTTCMVHKMYSSFEHGSY